MPCHPLLCSAGNRFLEKHRIIARPIPLCSIPNPAIHPPRTRGPRSSTAPRDLSGGEIRLSPTLQTRTSRTGTISSRLSVGLEPGGHRGPKLDPKQGGTGTSREGAVCCPPNATWQYWPLHNPPRNTYDRDGCSIALGTSRFAKYFAALFLFEHRRPTLLTIAATVAPIDTRPPQTPSQTQPSQRPLRGPVSCLDKPKPHSRLRSIMNLVSMCLPCVSVTPLARERRRKKKKKTNIEEKTPLIVHAGIGFLTPLGDKANRVLQTMKKRKGSNSARDRLPGNQYPK